MEPHPQPSGEPRPRPHARTYTHRLLCRACGARFTAKRCDAMTCSPACRKAISRFRRTLPG